jgi:hypothetical protein
MPLFVGPETILGDVVLDGPAGEGRGGLSLLFRGSSAPDLPPALSDFLTYPLGVTVNAVYPAGASLSTIAGLTVEPRVLDGLVVDVQVVTGLLVDPATILGLTNVG